MNERKNHPQQGAGVIPCLSGEGCLIGSREMKDGSTLIAWTKGKEDKEDFILSLNFW